MGLSEVLVGLLGEEEQARQDKMRAAAGPDWQVDDRGGGWVKGL